MRISDWSSDVCSSDLLLEDRLLALRGELDMLVGALHPVLQKASFLDIGDVHIFQADMAAVIGAQDGDNLAHRGSCEPQRPVETDRTVLVGADETVTLCRKRVGEGKSVAVLFEIGGSRRIK